MIDDWNSRNKGNFPIDKQEECWYLSSSQGIMGDIGYFPENLRLNLNKVDIFFFVTRRSNEVGWGLEQKLGEAEEERDKGVGGGRWGRRDKKQNWESRLLTVAPPNQTVHFVDLKHIYHVFSLLRFLRYFPLLIESIPNLHQGTQGHSNLNPVFLLWSYHTLNYFHSWSHSVLSYTYHCSFYLKFLPLSPFIHLASSKSNITSFGKFSLKYTLMKGNVHLSLMWTP